MQRFTRQQILAGLGVIIGIITVLALYIIFVNATQTPEAKISRPFAANMDHSKQVNQEELYYFSGSAFVSYNLKSYQTKPLTPIYALPKQVNDIVWSKRGALWHASTYAPTDRLYDTLVQNNLDPFYNYWWLFDFQTGNASLIGSPANDADVRQAIWQDDDTFIYSEKEKEGTDLLIFRVDIGAQPVQIAKVPETSSLVAATGENITYLKYADEKLMLVDQNIGTLQEKTLAGGMAVQEVLATGPDGSVIFISAGNNQLHSSAEVEGEGEVITGPLVVYDHTTDKTKTIEDSFSGNATWRHDANQWSAVGYDKTGKQVTIRSDDKGLTRFIVNSSNNSNYTAVGYDAAKQLDVISDHNNDLYYSGNYDATEIPPAPSTASLGSIINDPSFIMTYDSLDKVYVFYLQTLPSKTGLDAALKRIGELGVDPYQIKTKWYGTNGPGF